MSVWPQEPEADPLSRFLSSLDRFRPLPADTLVLPSHDWPFTGLGRRLDDVRRHHEARLDKTIDACAARSEADGEGDVLDAVAREARHGGGDQVRSWPGLLDPRTVLGLPTPASWGIVAAMTDPPDRPDEARFPILGREDPPVFELIDADGEAPVLLISDHAGGAIPGTLDRLGLEPRQLDLHIAYDIGAGDLTRRLAERLDAPALLQTYSRLVIDCNRSPGNPESIIEVSDEVPIPGNRDVGEDEATGRADAVFWPYHQAISRRLAHQWRRRGTPPILVSVHSFTPSLGDEDRPWDVGVLWNRDPRIAAPLMDLLERRAGVHVGDNLPYSGLESAYSIDVHGGVAGLANCVIEVRQDQLLDDRGVERWADILADSLTDILALENLHRVERF